MYRTGGSIVLFGFIDNHQYIGVSAANVVINDRAGQTRITSSLPNNAGYDDMLIYFFFELKGHKNCPDMVVVVIFVNVIVIVSAYIVFLSLQILSLSGNYDLWHW